MGAWECGEKVWKTLMSIEISNNKVLRSVRTLICSGGCGACEGQALALRLRRRAVRTTVVREPVPRYRFLILAILAILAILLQTIAIKVLTDLSIVSLLWFYRHSGPLDL